MFSLNVRDLGDIPLILGTDKSKKKKKKKGQNHTIYVEWLIEMHIYHYLIPSFRVIKNVMSTSVAESKYIHN